MKRFASLALILVTLALLFTSCAASDKGNSMVETSPSIGSGFQESGKEVVAEPAQRKIIKTYRLNAETKSFDDAVRTVESMVAEKGGYVESSTLTDRGLNNTSDSYCRTASYVLRIPAEQADAFVNAVGDTLHVTSNTSSVEDISDSYYTVEAALEELLAERDSLLAMMSSLDEKSDYNFWLTLQQRLSEVKQKIAVYQAQLNNYDSKVAYSTVNLSINEVINYSERAESNRFGSRLGAAFRESWISFWEGCQGFVIFLVSAFPTLLVVGGIAVGIVAIRRKVKKRKNERKTPEVQDPEV